MTKTNKFLCAVAVASIGLWGGSAVYAQSSMSQANSGQTSQGRMNTSSNASASRSKMKSSDASFARKADQADLAEVKMGELAQQKASSPAVKQFAERMVTDHSKANMQLKQVAAQDNITLPTKLDSKDQATYDKLSKLSGSQFDRQYMKGQVSDHEKVISEFKKEADSGKISGVRNFASETLPTLQEHLKLARSADQKVMASNNNVGGSGFKNGGPAE